MQTNLLVQEEWFVFPSKLKGDATDARQTSQAADVHPSTFHAITLWFKNAYGLSQYLAYCMAM